MKLDKFLMESLSAQEKNDNSHIIKKIALFGNGVVRCGVYHTLIVLDYGEVISIGNQTFRYRLLEVVDGPHGIRIHDVKANTEYEALNMRMRNGLSFERWGNDAELKTHDSVIQRVIDEYNGKKYVPFSPIFCPRNCRTFVNRVLKECGSTKRTFDFFRNFCIE